MARPKVHDEALRVRLLERARTVLSSEGPAGLSLRTLARDCDTSTTAVYSLFGGKTGLLTALFDDAFRTLGRRLSAVKPGADSLDDIVRLAWPTGAAR
jgi:AcrR family transcriptional regulator